MSGMSVLSALSTITGILSGYLSLMRADSACLLSGMGKKQMVQFMSSKGKLCNKVYLRYYEKNANSKREGKNCPRAKDWVFKRRNKRKKNPEFSFIPNKPNILLN
ncbi:hypothetical protein V8G54_017166 [Vigna mungo]|uniref:Uncharacterized protein n=1 Tax=Vigna mungo TaxID=3915 RepID=A0AAQ3NPD6_VIGMU